MTATVPHRLTTTLVTLVAPLAILAAAAIVAASWADDLPDPVAVHWDTHGPDGFGSLASAIVPMVVVGALAALGSWALAFWAGRAAATRRIAAGTSVGLAAFLSAIMLGSLDGQRGLADATQAPDAGSTLLVATLAGLVLGALAAFVVPRDAPRPAAASVAADAPRLDLAPTERAVWQRSAVSRAMIVTGVVVVVVVLAITVVARVWPLALVAVLLAGLLCSMAAFDVTVDQRGLVVRSLLGWPRVHVPLDEVAAARATSVDPLREFGGWGYRVGRGGRIGVVLRKGPAIEVQRSGDRVVVVTVDDAATGAALLNTLADRTRTA